jgi:hypothetical protein
MAGLMEQNIAVLYIVVLDKEYILDMENILDRVFLG